MHICTFTAKTTTRAQAVWQLWTNPKSWHRWDSGVQEVQMTGAFKQGATGTITYVDGSASPFTILSCDMVQKYVMSIPLSMGVELLLTREWHQDGAEVVFKQEVSLFGPMLAKLVHSGKRETLKKATLETLQNMMQLLEGDASTAEAPAHGVHKPVL